MAESNRSLLTVAGLLALALVGFVLLFQSLWIGSPSVQALALPSVAADGVAAKLAQQYLGVTHAPIVSIPAPAVPPLPCIDGMVFVQHLTLEDNLTWLTKMNPGQAFIKAWRIRNIGTCPWGTSFSTDFAQGLLGAARMGGAPTNLARSVQPGETYDLQVQMYAPILPGRYQAWWVMRNAQGVPFGQMLYVGIQVSPGAAPTPLPTQTPVPGISFTADLTTIKAGESVVLSWNATNVKAVYLYALGEPWEQRGVAGQGTRQIYLQNTTVYELRLVKPDDQIETRQIRIDVAPVSDAPLIARFTSDPAFQVAMGKCVNLTWEVQGAVTKVTLISTGSAIWDGAPLRGAIQNCPVGAGVVSYVLVASGPGGSNRAQRDITVNAPLTPTPVPPLTGPVINAFTINPNAVVELQCTTLNWDVGGTVSSVRLLRNDSVILDNGPLAGSAPDCSTSVGTFTFRLEARSLAGQVATRQVILTVNPRLPAREVDLAASGSNAPGAHPPQADPVTALALTLIQFIVYGGIAVTSAYVAAGVTGTRHAVGILGAFVAAPVGAFLAVNVFHILLAPEISFEGVPIITAIVGALSLALLWTIVAGGRRYRGSN